MMVKIAKDALAKAPARRARLLAMHPAPWRLPLPRLNAKD